MKRFNIFALLIVLFGFYTFNPLLHANLPFGRFLANDIIILINVLLFIWYSAFRHGERFKTSEESKIFLIYLLMIFFMTVVSKAEVSQHGGVEVIANIYKITLYSSFYYFSALVTMEKDYYNVLKIITYLGISITIIMIIQSIHGSTPILGATEDIDSDLHSFYYVGYWVRHNTIGFGLTRIVLPCTVILVWLFCYNFSHVVINRARKKSILLMLLFGLTIYINNSRGLLFGAGLSILIIIVMNLRIPRIRYTLFKGLIIFAVLLLTINIVLSNYYNVDILGIIWDRLYSAVIDIQEADNVSHNNWIFRLDEFNQYMNTRLDLSQILFGFGLYPRNSFLGISYMHMGLGDLLYRGGIFFSVWLLFYYIVLMRYLKKKMNLTLDPEIYKLAQSLYMFNIVWLGMFISVNFLWNAYYASVVGMVLALINKKERIKHRPVI